jgi:hypothetical protein
MGRVKNWVQDIEDDAWSMDREEFVEKHGPWFDDIYNEIAEKREEEFNLVEMQQALFRFIEGGKAL